MSPCLLIEFYFRLLPHTSARVDFQPFFILKRRRETYSLALAQPRILKLVAQMQAHQSRQHSCLYSFKCVSVTIKDLFLCKHRRGVAGYSATIKGVATGKKFGNHWPNNTLLTFRLPSYLL